MSVWVVLAIVAVVAVVMITSRRRYRRRVDWESMGLAMRRPHWAGQAVRTDHTQTITVELSELSSIENDQLNDLIATRDVQAVADYLRQTASWPEAKAIDYAEQVTGREYKT